MSDSDPDLEQAFAALRRQEQRDGPAFASVWQAAGRPRRSRRVRPFVLAAAAAPVVAAALLAAWLIRPGGPAPSHPAAGAPTLSAWRPATDFLLRTPGREILGETPPLGLGYSLGLGAPGLTGPSPSTERRSS